MTNRNRVTRRQAQSFLAPMRRATDALLLRLP